MTTKEQTLAFIRGIYQTGVKPSNGWLENGKILLLNVLVLLGVQVCFVLSILCIIEGLYPQQLYTLGGILLFLLNYYLISKGWHNWARNYYIGLGSLLIIMVSLEAYPQGLYTETENILLAFMANSMLLFNGKKRHISFWLLFLVLIALKVIREDHRGSEENLEVFILIQNTATLSVLLYLFIWFFYLTLSKALRESSESEQNLYATIDNISLFIALINPDGTYRVVNRQYEKVFNIPREQIIGKSAFEVTSQSFAEAQKRILEETLRTKKRVEFKEEKEMPDGTINIGHGKVTPILDDENNVVAIAGYVNNISELEQTKRELQQANRSKDMIFSIVTHDLNSPLSMFESMLTAADEKALTAENFVPFINQLKSRFSPIKNTITDLLKWANSSLNDLEVNTSVFETEGLIKEVAAMCQMFADQKEITIQSNDPSQKIKMDPGHFRIAIRNILQNAIKFSPLKSNVKVEQTKVDDWVEISIQDEGKGISESMIDQIMSGSTVSPQKGTKGELGSGIGLTLVTGLLAKNQCQLKIESKKGTRMTIRIPAG